MKTVIVATDYSDSAEAALNYAAFIARYTKAKLALLNVYTFDIHALNGLITPAAIDDILKKNQSRLDKYAQTVSLKLGYSVATYCLTSLENDALEKLAKRTDAGLIVMGMRKNPDEESLTGNTSNTIINNKKVPVLVVPDKAALKIPERLLYACDYHSVPNDNHLQELKEIASAFNAELKIFHISKTPQTGGETELRKEIAKKLENVVGAINHSYQVRNSKDVIEGLKDGIKEFQADILIMSPHKYGFWRSLVHKSKTRQMVLNSSIPLLSVPS